MKLFDTHAHLNDRQYAEDLMDVIERAKNAGLEHIILATACEQDCLDVLPMVKKYTSEDLNFWCTVGVHPHDATEYNDRIDALLRGWIEERKEKRIVAIGEIGLDYFYDHSPRDIQRQVFRKQLDIAFDMNIPFVIHERDAIADLLEILAEYASQKRLRQTPGACHCFSGSPETAKILLSYGFYLGFDGPLTFKNSRRAPEVVQMTPSDRLLLETDSPYLSPVPYRGKRNEPAYVRLVLDKMAELKGLSPEEMAEITTLNACRLFEIL